MEKNYKRRVVSYERMQEEKLRMGTVIRTEKS